MENLKISFITTVLNEEKTIKSFLVSISNQSKLSNEIIIVDGGSTDATVSIISDFKFSNIKVKLIIKKGNRSVGRNEAIRKASNEIIACSDSGCILDKDWLKKITKPFSDKKIKVVAGYYKAKSQSLFEKCLVPYVLVMEDKVNPNKFLPSARSIAFRKFVWKKLGGFDERYSNNEDYVFARRLREKGINVTFVKDAIAYWLPRKKLTDAFKMFYSFAKGDAESKTFRVKPFLIIIRYLFGMLLLVFSFMLNSPLLLSLFIFLFISYIFWAIRKNYRYVASLNALYMLPVIQFSSDLAVMLGTITGSVKYFRGRYNLA